MDSQLSILIVDDHKLFAAGLSRLVADLAPSVKVTEKYSAAQAITALENGEQFDLVLFELDLPVMSGLEFLLAMRSRRIQARPVVISASENLEAIQGIMQVGAKGFIPKSSSITVLAEALRRVLADEVFMPDYLSVEFSQTNVATKAASPPAQKLSGRQEEIVQLIQMGKTNKQIAEILDIKQCTVKFHISALFKALDVHTRTECVHVVRQRNLTA